jgi:hypothetical protein
MFNYLLEIYNYLYFFLGFLKTEINLINTIQGYFFCTTN